MLIVGGVWGEVFFANKARIAGDKELEKYRMRPAEASHKAAEANLELAKFRSARSISNAQADEIAARLKEFSASYDVAVSTNDSEIMAFLYLLHGMLGKAGWIALPWNAPTPKIRPIIGPEIASGFPILNVIISAGSEGLRLASRKLAEELKAVGIEASAHGVAVMGNAMSKNNAIHIWIGRKA